MSDIFRKFSPPTPPPPKQPYLAFGLVKPTQAYFRVEIYRPDGSIFTLQDAILVKVISADPQFCALFYDKCMIQLEGYNLSGLVDLLKHYEIRFAEVFNPEIHEQPAADAPLIDHIQYKSVLEADNRFILSPSYQLGISLIRMH